VAFSRGELDALLELAADGIADIMGYQAQLLADPPAPRALGR
jgi:hypothetical protein